MTDLREREHSTTSLKARKPKRKAKKRSRSRIWSAITAPARFVGWAFELDHRHPIPAPRVAASTPTAPKGSPAAAGEAPAEEETGKKVSRPLLVVFGFFLVLALAEYLGQARAAAAYSRALRLVPAERTVAKGAAAGDVHQALGRSPARSAALNNSYTMETFEWRGLFRTYRVHAVYAKAPASSELELREITLNALPDIARSSGQ